MSSIKRTTTDVFRVRWGMLVNTFFEWPGPPSHRWCHLHRWWNGMQCECEWVRVRLWDASAWISCPCLGGTSNKAWCTYLYYFACKTMSFSLLGSCTKQAYILAWESTRSQNSCVWLMGLRSLHLPSLHPGHQSLQRDETPILWTWQASKCSPFGAALHCFKFYGLVKRVQPQTPEHMQTGSWPAEDVGWQMVTRHDVCRSLSGAECSLHFLKATFSVQVWKSNLSIRWNLLDVKNTKLSWSTAQFLKPFAISQLKPLSQSSGDLRGRHFA